MTAEQERSIKWKNNVNNPKINPNISVHRKGSLFNNWFRENCISPHKIDLMCKGFHTIKETLKNSE